MSGGPTRSGVKALLRRSSHVQRLINGVVGAQRLDTVGLADAVAIQVHFSRVGDSDDDRAGLLQRAHVGSEAGARAPDRERRHRHGKLVRVANTIGRDEGGPPGCTHPAGECGQLIFEQVDAPLQLLAFVF